MYPSLDIIGLTCAFIMIAKASNTIPNPGQDSSKDGVDDIFDQFSEEISRTQLRYLLQNLEINIDGKITLSELEDWIGGLRRYRAEEMAKRQLVEYDMNKDGQVAFEEYFQYNYGNESAGETNKAPDDVVFQAKKRDRARWKYADLNHDKQLNIEELAAFEIPEDFEYMKDFMLEEAYDSVDKNKDGKLSLKEFLGSDVVNNDSGIDSGETKFRENFFKHLKDRNQDGFLDMNEVKPWLSKSYSSRIVREANVFMREIDKNKDKVLTTDEILENWDDFKNINPSFENILLQHDEL